MLLWGCGRSTGAATLAYGSSGDVDEILKKNGVTVTSLHCDNPKEAGSVTRAVACTTSLSPAQLAALTSSVPLRTGKPAPYGTADNCESAPGLRSRDVGVDVLVGKNTKVPNGAAAIEVHFAAASGRACIEIHYPWG